MNRLITLFLLIFVCPLLADDSNSDEANRLMGDKAYSFKYPSAPLSVGPTTAHGYDSFCANTDETKKIMKALDQITNAEMVKINQSAKEINSLRAKKIILADFLKAREEFKASFDKIIKEKNLQTNLENNIDHFKKLLNSSLILSTVNLMAKSKTDQTSILKLCEEKENEKSQFCNETKTVLGFRLEGFCFTEEQLKILDNTLQNANLALKNTSLAEQPQLKETLKMIYNSTYQKGLYTHGFPLVHSPEKVLEELIVRAPDLTSALSKSSKKDDIIKCLKHDNETCRQLLKNPNNKNSFKELMSSGMNVVQQAMISQEFDSSFDNFSKGANEYNKVKKTEINKNTKKFLASFMGAANEKMAMFTPKDLEELKANCTATKDEDINADACKDISTKIITSLEDKEKTLSDFEKKENEKLAALTGESSPLAINEKMKKYVTEKYMRTCRTGEVIQSNFTCKYVKDNLQNNIEALGSSVGPIVGMIENNAALSNRGELGAFSKDELNVYLNFCNNTSASTTHTSICNDVQNEVNRIAHQKESKEWKEFHNKYWVVYDSKSKKGYEVYEKKSNWRILGEGLSQSVNSIYPIWFTNMQMNYQIDMMTNQALYQKQMMYMNSPNSPWMTSPYFQGSFYPTNNTGFNFTN